MSNHSYRQLANAKFGLVVQQYNIRRRRHSATTCTTWPRCTSSTDCLKQPPRTRATWTLSGKQWLLVSVGSHAMMDFVAVVEELGKTLTATPTYRTRTGLWSRRPRSRWPKRSSFNQVATMNICVSPRSPQVQIRIHFSGTERASADGVRGRAIGDCADWAWHQTLSVDDLKCITSRIYLAGSGWHWFSTIRSHI